MISGFQVCVAFNPSSTIVATGSMDTTAKLWDVQTGAEITTLEVRFSHFTFKPLELRIIN